MCGCKKKVCRNNLIRKLYYKARTKIGDEYVDNAETIDFLTRGPDDIYSGLAFARMTDSNYAPLNNTKILFEGYRKVPTNPISGIDQAQYYEKVLIQTPDGEIEAAALYDDSGTGSTTTVPFVDYQVNHATKCYKKTKIVRILFDNDGSIFGTKYSRVVELYR